MDNKPLTHHLFTLLEPKVILRYVVLVILAVICINGNAWAEGECASMAEMAKRWEDTCYACLITKTLIETFMAACAHAYDLTRDAGIKLLVIGLIIWVIPFTMKNMSSLTSVEAPNMVQEILVMGFKVIVAYVFITAGIGTLIGFAINPFLAAGADFAQAIMSSAADKVSFAVDPKYAYSGPSDIISVDVMNKILAFSQDVSNHVSINMIIGEGLMCYAVNGAATTFGISIIGASIDFPDFWLLFCGFAIWFMGFMLTISICYYLLDISYKLGFMVLVLPIVIGLWPFNWGKNKLSTCLSIVFKAAATFAFLAITTSYAITLINKAINGTDRLMQAIQEDDLAYVDATFTIFGGPFLIIAFCYIYAIKLVGSTTMDFVNQFFPDGVFGNESPLHGKMTAITARVQGAVMAPALWAKDVIAHQAGKATLGLSKKAASGLKSAWKNPNKAGQNAVGNSAKGVGQGVKATGQAAENAGKATEAAGKTAQAAGKGAQAAGKGMAGAGKGMAGAGKALSSTGLGAIIGVPLMAVGYATQAAGKGVEMAGKAAEQAGKATEKAGKAMKKAGKAVKDTGSKIEKAGDHVNAVAEKDDKKDDKKKDE